MLPIRAKLEFLKGKYYNTKLVLFYPNNVKQGIDLNINSYNDERPSDRELLICKNCKYEYPNCIDNRYYQNECDAFCDDHYEKQSSLDLANFIINKINEVNK